MLADQNAVRKRIDELRLSCEGYKRQLRAQTLSGERRERLNVEVGLMEEEIGTLEKIAQLGRVEEDRGKIETIVRERLDVLRERMAQDNALASLQADQYEYTSGEFKALLWVVGEDLLTQNLRLVVRTHNLSKSDPAQATQAVADMLMRAVRDGKTIDMRASTAYDIGRLHIVQALPQLAAALRDHPQVAEVALQALKSFSADELSEAGLTEEVRGRVLGK
ncbi:MAG TPA: hypothetical protein VJ183_14480 [Chloroflexia bacterium]|nr:hypothetical protein [Chloroflexia bacterium]